MTSSRDNLRHVVRRQMRVFWVSARECRFYEGFRMSYTSTAVIVLLLNTRGLSFLPGIA